MHQVLLKPFFFPLVSCLPVSEVCLEGRDAAEQKAYAVLSPGISNSAHLCTAIPQYLTRHLE